MNIDLRAFLLISTQHLHQPIKVIDEFGNGRRLRSWCSWTTYGRLTKDAGYWAEELPEEHEIGPTYVADGGTWGQPFRYDNDLAHVIIPRNFADLRTKPVYYEQDIDGLSARLTQAAVAHRISKYVLEIKLF